ncbi:hypothetical protein BHE74_00001252 [Ensete ventricosum]|nr:hypothetical protein GW17_00053833 [Ensete ventricosum]RWW89714.1 hypothetical protein BHE74_00001252 [Ensete ventricosum]RZR78572.1 hypothetical protein BHM03_00003975 [Ensete ventricosum]
MGVDRTSWALSTIPFTISGKAPEYPTNTKVQKDISNKIGIYRKHIWNHKSCMCLIEII